VRLMKLAAPGRAQRKITVLTDVKVSSPAVRSSSTRYETISSSPARAWASSRVRLLVTALSFPVRPYRAAPPPGPFRILATPGGMPGRAAPLQATAGRPPGGSGEAPGGPQRVPA